jgi:hypothetical protein
MACVQQIRTQQCPVCREPITCFGPNQSQNEGGVSLAHQVNSINELLNVIDRTLLPAFHDQLKEFVPATQRLLAVVNTFQKKIPQLQRQAAALSSTLPVRHMLPLNRLEQENVRILREENEQLLHDEIELAYHAANNLPRYQRLIEQFDVSTDAIVSGFRALQDGLESAFYYLSLKNLYH